MSEIILPEIVAVGIYNTRHSVRGREVTKTRKTSMFELELSTEAGGISYINEESSPITERLFICAKPGESRHTRLPYRCYYVHFMLSGGALYDMLNECPHYFEPSEYREYEAIFEGLCQHGNTGLLRDRLMMQSHLLRLLYLVSDEERRIALPSVPKSNNERAIRTAIDYIRTNLNADLRLSTLAERVSFSPIHFHNCFRSATGRTLRDYVEEQRIKKAINLLAGTDLTLSDIAYECGFSSQAYFSYAFKKRMHATPREYARGLLERYDK